MAADVRRTESIFSSETTTMGNRFSATTLDPEMTDEELSGLEGWLQTAGLTGVHLEIGTAAGGSLCFMMNLYSDADRPRFSVIDTMSYFKDQLTS